MEYIPKKLLIEKFNDSLCDVFALCADEDKSYGFSRDLVNKIINSIYTVTFPDY